MLNLKGRMNQISGRLLKPSYPGGHHDTVSFADLRKSFRSEAGIKRIQGTRFQVNGVEETTRFPGPASIRKPPFRSAKPTVREPFYSSTPTSLGGLFYRSASGIRMEASFLGRQSRPSEPSNP